MDSNNPNDDQRRRLKWVWPAAAGLFFFQLIWTFLPALGVEPWQWVQAVALLLAVPSAVIFVVVIVAAIRRGIASQR